MRGIMHDDTEKYTEMMGTLNIVLKGDVKTVYRQADHEGIHADLDQCGRDSVGCDRHATSQRMATWQASC